MKRKSLLAKAAVPILACALLICGVSAFRWVRVGAIRRHFDRAEAFVRQQRGPEAEAEWKAVLQADPHNTAAYELLGEYYMSRHNWPAGADAFRKLAKADPHKPHVQCRLAACLLRMDDQQGAFQTAQAELRKDPDCVAALGLVTSLMAQRPNSEQKQQLEYLRRLARLIPDDMMVQHEYAEALSNQYLYDELRPVLTQILRRNPNDVEAYNLLGFADLARADQPQGAQAAIQDFQTSLRLASANSGAHFGLGRAYLRAGEPLNAVAELEQAAKRLPEVARVHKELADAYRAAHQPAKAAREQARSVALLHLAGDERMLMVRCIAYPNDPNYPRRLGELYVRLGDPSRALYYLNKAKHLTPGDPKLEALIAKVQETAVHETASASPYLR